MQVLSFFMFVVMVVLLLLAVGYDLSLTCRYWRVETTKRMYDVSGDEPQAQDPVQVGGLDSMLGSLIALVYYMIPPDSFLTHRRVL